MKTTILNNIKLWYYKSIANAALKISQKYYTKSHMVQMSILYGVASAKEIPDKMKDLNQRMSKAAEHLRQFQYISEPQDRITLQGGVPKMTPVVITTKIDGKKAEQAVQKQPFVAPQRKKKKFYYHNNNNKKNNQNNKNSNTTKE